MFNFLKKIFTKSKFTKKNTLKPAQNEVKQSVVMNGFESDVHHNEKTTKVEIRYNLDFLQKHNNAEYFKRLIEELTGPDGYKRQSILERLKDCYQPEFFPFFLRRLSDYVPINRQLAAEHILSWSAQAEFGRLCIDNFKDIAEIQGRIRIVSEAEVVLLQKSAEELDYLKQIMLGTQGHLARILLQYVRKYDWIAADALIEYCKAAKDQQVRKFWLENIAHLNNEIELKQALLHSPFKDVQLRLLDHLQSQNLIDIEDLILLWHSRYYAVVDYAAFLLRQRDFDFESYFQQHSISSLDSKQSCVRANQYMTIKWNKNEFFSVLRQILTRDRIFAYLLRSLKQKYIEIDDFLSFVESDQIDLRSVKISKISDAIQRKLFVDELLRYLALLSEKPKFEDLILYQKNFNFWDSLYWVVYLEEYALNHDQVQQLRNHLVELIGIAKYQTFGPLWNVKQAEEVFSFLDSYFKTDNQILNTQEKERFLGLIEKKISI